MPQDNTQASPKIPKIKFPDSPENSQNNTSQKHTSQNTTPTARNSQNSEAQKNTQPLFTHIGPVDTTLTDEERDAWRQASWKQIADFEAKIRESLEKKRPSLLGRLSSSWRGSE
ncbi:hypothetical protein HYFRA_00005381 [Hymenoscyphus fraxineus]|uniref:Uncharacterized protein n=1 Tax=Hymenoscyphus fraxineus TaxID=746836 RepID=A0A9N9LC60_9HELO|nr:hypothetical protein HYFRA_00005381 [Hymenoscyphus fraxineus]